MPTPIGRTPRPLTSGLRVVRLTFAIIVGFSVAAGALAVVHFDSSARNAAVDRLRADVAGQAAAIGRLFDEADRDLRLARQNAVFDVAGLASGVTVTDLDRAQMDEALVYLGTRYSVDEICLIAADGREIARWDAVAGAAAGVDLSPDETEANPTFARAMVSDDDVTVRSDIYRSPDTARWVVGLGTPLYLPDGRRAGLLHMEIPVARFAASLAAARDEPGARHVLVHGDRDLVGEVGSRPLGDPGAGHDLDLVPGWAARLLEAPEATTVQIDGVALRVERQAVLGGLTLLTAVPERVVFGQIDDAERVLLLIAGPLVAVLIVAGLLAVLYAERMTRRLNEALRGVESRYRTIVDQIPAITYVRRVGSGPIEYVSPHVESVLGYTVPEVLESPVIAEAIHPDERSRVEGIWAAADRDGTSVEMEYRIVHRDGRVRWVEEIARLVRDEQTGAALFWHGIMLDVSDRAEARAALDRRERQFRDLLESVPTVVYTSLAGSSGAWTYVSPRIKELLGFDPDAWMADPDLWSARLHPDDRDWVTDNENEASASGRPTNLVEYRMLTKSGETRWVRDEMSASYGPDGSLLYWNGFLTDVTDRRELEEQLRHQAFHDALTGLPNRSLFLDRVEHALQRQRRRPGAAAVLYLDLDNFKAVNDSLGHEAGDRLLIAAAQRLAGSIRGEDTPARLSGDEFAALLEDVADLDEAIGLARRVQAAFAAPFQIDGVDVFVSASIGVAQAGRDETDAEHVLRRADVAMYVAKARGKGGIERYENSMGTASRERIALQGDLHHAIERGEMRLVYQPIRDMRSGRISSFEALLRWDHPVRGLLPPSEFIPIAEETGLILPIGRWVIREACHQAAEWSRLFADAGERAMAVNLSARQLQDDTLIETIREALADEAMDPRLLILEITESLALARDEPTLVRLRELSKLGVRIAIDDFGTGYSSLSSLRGLPIDVLKIDKAFIDDITHDERARSLAQTIVRMGQELGLRVVAEGIEEDEQARVLLDLGCDLGQGFLFARPLTQVAMAAYLADLAEAKKAV